MSLTGEQLNDPFLRAAQEAVLSARDLLGLGSPLDGPEMSGLEPEAAARALGTLVDVAALQGDEVGMASYIGALEQISSAEASTELIKAYTKAALCSPNMLFCGEQSSQKLNAWLKYEQEQVGAVIQALPPDTWQQPPAPVLYAALQAARELGVDPLPDWVDGYGDPRFRWCVDVDHYAAIARTSTQPSQAHGQLKSLLSELAWNSENYPLSFIARQVVRLYGLPEPRPRYGHFHEPRRHAARQVVAAAANLPSDLDMLRQIVVASIPQTVNDLGEKMVMGKIIDKHMQTLLEQGEDPAAVLLEVLPWRISRLIAGGHRGTAGDEKVVKLYADLQAEMRQLAAERPGYDEHMLSDRCDDFVAHQIPLYIDSMQSPLARSLALAITSPQNRRKAILARTLAADLQDQREHPLRLSDDMIKELPELASDLKAGAALGDKGATVRDEAERLINSMKKAGVDEVGCGYLFALLDRAYDLEPGLVLPLAKQSLVMLRAQHADYRLTKQAARFALQKGDSGQADELLHDIYRTAPEARAEQYADLALLLTRLEQSRK